MKRKSPQNNIVYGVFAPRTDWRHEERDNWRPIISLCSFTDFPVAELHLIHAARYTHLVESLKGDIAEVSPATAFFPIVRPSGTSTLEELYVFYYVYFNELYFDTAHNDYYIYLPFGVFPQVSYAIVMAINCLSLPLKIIQVYQYEENSNKKDNYTIFETNLSKPLVEHALYLKNHLPDQDFLKSGIATQNVHYNRLIAHLEHVSVNSRSPILLTGDTGTGKSRLAQSVYELKKRHGLISGKFIAINCSMLRGDMGMAALFGHARGAFTGALQQRQGYIVAAHQGVLFLDEVGEMRLEEQVLLLNALEEKAVLPLGSDTPVHSDFQLICGTNQDLAKMVQAGSFRRDLLARINIWHFELPALRQRVEDILPNIDYELKRHSLEKGRNFLFSNAARVRFHSFALSPEALWLGNFRELSASIDRMTTFSVDNVLNLAVVEEEIARLTAAWRLEQDGDALTCVSDTAVLDMFLGEERRKELDLFEHFHLANTLRVCLGSPSKAEAGKRLYAVSRLRKRHCNDANRLHKYLQHYDLSWDSIQAKKGLPWVHSSL